MAAYILAEHPTNRSVSKTFWTDPRESGRRFLASTAFVHYWVLATEAEGKAWFSILPRHSAANAVHLPRTAKG